MISVLYGKPKCREDLTIIGSNPIVYKQRSKKVTQNKHKQQRQQQQQQQNPSRKNNSRHTSQSKASVYFAEQSLLKNQFSKLMVENGETLEHRLERLSILENAYNEKSVDDDASFLELVSTNPMFIQHKTVFGRRNGVSARNEWDSVVLSELSSGFNHERNVSLEKLDRNGNEQS